MISSAPLTTTPFPSVTGTKSLPLYFSQDVESAGQDKVTLPLLTAKARFGVTIWAPVYRSTVDIVVIATINECLLCLWAQLCILCSLYRDFTTYLKQWCMPVELGQCRVGSSCSDKPRDSVALQDCC